MTTRRHDDAAGRALDAALGITRTSHAQESTGLPALPLDEPTTPPQDAPAGGGLVAELVAAGLIQAAATRVAEAHEAGATPQAAAMSETTFGAGGVRDQSVPVATIRARVVRLLTEHGTGQAGTSDPDAVLRGKLRAALSAARGHAVTEADAETELDKIRQAAIRDGLSLPYFYGRVHKELGRLHEVATRRTTGRTTTTTTRPRTAEAARRVTIRERGNRR